jgi:hypothetical protein
MTNQFLREIPWLRSFVEGTVIVGSILLAFGIDAWWVGVGERDRDRGHLAALREEFSETLSQIVEEEALRDFAARSAASLIGQIQGNQRAEADSLYLWFSLASMPIAFNPPMAVFDAAATSGAVQRIRLDDLRIALVQYRPLLARLREQDEAASAVSALRLQPFLEGRVPRVERLRRGLVGSTGEYPWRRHSRAAGLTSQQQEGPVQLPFGPSPHAPDFDAVFGEPALEDMLAERWFRLAMGSVRLAEVETRLVEVISLIDLELGEAD